jgi:hypothetical protein
VAAAEAEPADDDIAAAVQPEMDIEDVEALEDNSAAPPPVDTAAVLAAQAQATAEQSDPLPEPEEDSSAEAAEPEPAPAATIQKLEGPVRAIKSRARVNLGGSGTPEQTNGNGNGTTHAPTANGSNSNGSSEHQESSNRTLHVHLPRTDDLMNDTRTMQDVHELLRANEGNDDIRLYMLNGVGRVVLQPYYRVQVTPGLLDMLHDMLGEASVSVADR